MHHCKVDANLQNPSSELYSLHVIHTTAEIVSVTTKKIELNAKNMYVSTLHKAMYIDRYQMK